MLRRLPLVILVLAILLRAQDHPTFRADVSQIHVDAEVLSKDGRIIPGLSKSDFRVFDEGQEQTLVGFAFVHSTYIQEALVSAAKHFLGDSLTHRRRAVLIITDNLGIRTRKDMSVVRVLWEADAVLCGLTIPDPGAPVRRAMVAIVAPYTLAKVGGMEGIAEKTGGDTIRSNDPSDAFPEIVRRIRSRYSLYYATPEGKPGSFRNIRVELARETQDRFPQARVYARRGYRLTQQR